MHTKISEMRKCSRKNMKFPKKSKKGNFQENEKKILIALKGKIYIPPKNFNKKLFQTTKKKREKKSKQKFKDLHNPKNSISSTLFF